MDAFVSSYGLAGVCDPIPGCLGFPRYCYGCFMCSALGGARLTLVICVSLTLAANGRFVARILM